MPKPFISIVIPCFNGEETLSKTLDTVCAQTFKDFEVVIVNNGSTDSSLEIMESYQNRLPINIISQDNAGVGGARNTGILNSLGEFVALLDADDLWVDTKLQSVFDTIKSHNNNLDVICHYEYLQKDGINIRILEHGPYTDYLDLLFKGNSLSPSATVVRRSMLNDVGLFSLDEKGHGAEDWDLWLKLAKNGARIHYIKKVLGIYILHDKNFSAMPEFIERCQYVFESHVSSLDSNSPELHKRIAGARAINQLNSMKSQIIHRQYIKAVISAWKGFLIGFNNSFFWQRLFDRASSMMGNNFR